MKPFQFQKFTINQSSEVFRVGTDAVLLGALCNLKNSKKTLEIGCGTGVISMMIAQRYEETEILALDINPKAVELCQTNFQNSIFRDRLHAIEIDYTQFSNEKKWDAVISNPPYFEENPSEKDVIARQKRTLSFENLIKKTSEILSKEGIFSVILPIESTEEFINLCSQNRLSLIRRINIFGIKDGPLKRCILEFSPEKHEVITEDFVIEKAPRQYSDEYLELTRDFHVFRPTKS